MAMEFSKIFGARFVGAELREHRPFVIHLPAFIRRLMHPSDRIFRLSDKFKKLPVNNYYVVEFTFGQVK